MNPEVASEPIMYMILLWSYHVLAGFKFNFFDSLLKLASGIIFYLLNLSANVMSKPVF